jgi:hypothetical protein
MLRFLRRFLPHRFDTVWIPAVFGYPKVAVPFGYTQIFEYTKMGRSAEVEKFR